MSVFFTNHVGRHTNMVLWEAAVLFVYIKNKTETKKAFSSFKVHTQTRNESLFLLCLVHFKKQFRMK
jgi:hypothetical protein